MISVRVALFITTLLGFMYALLSLTNFSKTDIGAGMVIAALGVIGWVAMDIWEEHR